MEFSLTNIIAFLSGSLGTLIIKGFIDLVIKKMDFKHELRKNFFEKKLAAAEEAIKSLFNSYQSTIVLVNALDNLLEKEMDNDYFDEIWDNYSDKIIKSEDKIFQSSVSLFFQLEDEVKWNNEDQKELFEIYSNIKIMSEEVHYWDSELDKRGNKKRKESINKRMELLRDELMTELKKLSDKLTKSYTAIFSNIETIKLDIKKGL